MDWVALAAMVLATGAFVFAVVMDKKNAEALGKLFELITAVIDSVKDGEE